jgi:predicted metal-dependent phosphoesterase TrpH
MCKPAPKRLTSAVGASKAGFKTPSPESRPRAARSALHYPVLKTELHAHTDADPADRIAHSTRELVDHAAALGYGALAVTLHDRYFDPGGDRDYARERGIVLMAGIERTIERRHVLLINFPADSAGIRSFEDVARLKARHPAGLVIAPHPFYPTPSALGALLARHAALFDAIEINAMYTRFLDFNRGAAASARRHAKPLVGNTDLHLLDQMGTTYSLVNAEPDADAICHAIRAGRVTVHTTPLSSMRAAQLFTRMCWGGAQGRLLRRLQPR